MTSSRCCPHLGMQTGDLGLPQNSLWIQQLQTIGWVIERPLVHLPPLSHLPLLPPPPSPPESHSLWIQQLQTIVWVIERPLVHLPSLPTPPSPPESHSLWIQQLQTIAVPFRDQEEEEGKSPRVLGEVLCTEEPVGPEGAGGLVWELVETAWKIASA